MYQVLTGTLESSILGLYKHTSFSTFANFASSSLNKFTPILFHCRVFNKLDPPFPIYSLPVVWSVPYKATSKILNGGQTTTSLHMFPIWFSITFFHISAILSHKWNVSLDRNICQTYPVRDITSGEMIQGSCFLPTKYRPQCNTVIFPYQQNLYFIGSSVPNVLLPHWLSLTGTHLNFWTPIYLTIPSSFTKVSCSICRTSWIPI